MLLLALGLGVELGNQLVDETHRHGPCGHLVEFAFGGVINTPNPYRTQAKVQVGLENDREGLVAGANWAFAHGIGNSPVIELAHEPPFVAAARVGRLVEAAADVDQAAHKFDGHKGLSKGGPTA